MRRALFLFNHDAAHQVAHLARIAAGMASRYPHIETIIAYANEGLRGRIETILGPDIPKQIVWIELRLSPLMQTVTAIFDHLAPASRLARLRSHAALFASCDIIVSSERTFLRIKRALPDDKRPLFAKIPHGAGDRAVTFHKDNLEFDLLLVSGQKFHEEFVRSGVADERIRIVGYPKFEGVDLTARPRFFDNDLPTFLYNPHFDPHLSSWYNMGPDLLRWFAGPEGQKFNCIFAPHVMLFRKKRHFSLEHRVLRTRPDVPPEVAKASNILVDTGSAQLMDMSYTLGSDAYIGDISSQIYEFLARPRPTFFLDQTGAVTSERDAPPLFHQAGPVFSELEQLVASLPDYARIGSDYRAMQEELFAHTFDFQDQPPSQRAAAAIAALIDRTH